MYVAVVLEHHGRGRQGRGAPEGVENFMTEEEWGMKPPDKDGVFDQHRDLLMAVAYCILGQVADAEDVVQEA
jgi:hypothetical protein